MDIEVNDYVRTKEGYLGILIAINKQDYNYLVVDTSIEIRRDGYPSTYLYLKKENIKKYSKELIDLIEIGDIVNGCIVVGFGYECVNGNKEKSILVEGKYTKVNYALLNWDIETILTHEQFERNSYKVGGEYEIS